MQKELDFEYNELITPFEWSYSPYTKMWYEDYKEITPEFQMQNDAICSNINAYLNLDNGFDDILNNNYDETSAEKQFKGYIDYLFGKTESGYDCFDITLIFCCISIKSKSGLNDRMEICISNENLPEMEKFINNIKQYGYASIYIEAFSGVKLFCWEHGVKLHFAIQDYKQQKYYGTDKTLFKVLFNVLIDKNIFYKEMTNIISKYKEKCKIAIANYKKEHQGTTISDYDKHFTDWVLAR